MAKKRKFCAYRSVERPYTRFSKYKKMSFVKAKPTCRVVRFNMGNLTRKFPYKISLISKGALQIRDNALESARLTSNRALEGVLGKKGFRMTLNVYPHHILRENPLAAGAGADRMSTGMKASFGKTIGLAAQIKRGQKIMEAFVNKKHVPLAKTALKRASTKLPASYLIEISEVQ